MPDIFDRAQQREAEMAEQINRVRPAQPVKSLTHCLDCEEPIPADRMAHGGVERCVPCQNDYESLEARGLV
ncbi:hypothetical protein R50073_24550 [Maricurvus nonylphenolicus]|uniref:TraR/DksA C4-type zinc finger protein n=1 Tax=Maricurvus nonylphenolicus TaxID=1008307 RepID=UPI0036F4300F